MGKNYAKPPFPVDPDHPYYAENPCKVITALETRSSAPIKINRNEYLTTNISNVYAIGEGSGYAGGITTSAIDGIKVAIKLIENDRSNYGK